MDLISVITPSRRRIPLLEDSVASLLETAAHPEAIEILVAADPDDTATQQVTLPQVRVWTAPQRYGYRGLSMYYNALAEQAVGVWLMIWNDDAFMETPGWDDLIRAQAPGVLWERSELPGTPFPVIPAAWVRHLGRMCPSTHIDMWVNDIGRLTGTGHHLPISIKHDRTYDQTFAEADLNGNFWEPAMCAEREADVQKIRELLAAG